MKELNKENWSNNLKRFHANLEQVNEEFDKIAPELIHKCTEAEADDGQKIVFQHSFPCDGDVLFIALEGNTATKQIQLTHFKWVEHNEESP